MKKIEYYFEQFLWKSRFLVLIAVVSSLIGSLVLFVVGTLDIFKVGISTINYYLGRSEQDIHEFIVTDIILAVDIYLVAVVLLMFGAGVYRLFIVRVVILAVIIEFFRAVVDIQFITPLDAIYLALSVLALAASVYLMNMNQGKKTEVGKK
jgi:uncharacterized membrane protein YqhA